MGMSKTFDDFSDDVDKHVAAFKAHFAAAPRLLADGQFTLTLALLNEQERIVTEECKGVWGATQVLDWYKKLYLPAAQAADFRVMADVVLRQIRTDKLEGQLPRTLGILLPDASATPGWAAGEYATVWTSQNIVAAQVRGVPTVDRVRAMRVHERDRCAQTARSLCRKVVLAQNGPKRRNPLNFSAGVIPGTQPPRPYGHRQVLIYDRPRLATAVAGVRAGLARGHLYLCGVLSGGLDNDSGQRFPNPEHWIVLFAADDDAFLFWDPDAGSSNIRRNPTWGAGFGVLVHAAGRLSTAWDQQDFDAACPLKINARGRLEVDSYHTELPERHCYQAYLLDPVP